MWPSTGPKTIWHSFFNLTSHVLTCTFLISFIRCHFNPPYCILFGDTFCYHLIFHRKCQNINDIFSGYYKNVQNYNTLRVRVKCYHMFPLVTTGYHLAPSEKIMLPHVTDQSKMAKRFDSSSFRAIHPPGAEK